MLTNLFFNFSNKLRDIKTDCNEELWHYTSSTGVLGIIKNDSLWFSDRRFLNDKTECNYIYELMHKLIKEDFF